MVAEKLRMVISDKMIIAASKITSCITVQKEEMKNVNLPCSTHKENMIGSFKWHSGSENDCKKTVKDLGK
jgi:hypothetical protein